MSSTPRLQLVIAHADPFVAADLAARLFMHWPEVIISAVLHHGTAVLDTLTQQRPDILIIDPCIAELTGLEISLNEQAPVMVFLANSTPLHALYQSIKVNSLALPLSEHALSDLIQQLKTAPCNNAENLAQLYRVRSALAAHEQHPRWVAAYFAQQMHWLDLKDVLYVARDQERTLAQTASYRYVIPQELEAVQALLPEHFAAASTDLYVNTLGISYAHPNEQGQLQIGLRQREELLNVSDDYAHHFQ